MKRSSSIRCNRIKDVSFRMEKGEKVAFVGENGAGKTWTGPLCLERTSAARICPADHSDFLAVPCRGMPT